MEQLTFDFIKEIIPIPDCSFLMDVTGLGTPIEVASAIVTAWIDVKRKNKN